MLRKGILVVVLIAASQGFCFGQGFLDSVFGPGGLGIWGGDASNLTNQQFQGAPQQQQQVYPGQQAQYPANAYPQNPYYNQQGVYGDWQNYPAATIGPQGQYPAEQQYQAPQQQYQQPQYSNQPQGFPPVQAPPQMGSQQPVGAQFQQQPMLPQQYPPGPPAVSAEDLPAGAVRMTTTTPDGTTVQYYPPEGEPMQAPGMAPATPQQPRRIRVKPAAPKQQAGARATQPREKTGVTTPAGGIAMPKPVEVPQGDPRYGWGAAPVAPETR
jgi:hypothetical protein